MRLFTAISLPDEIKDHLFDIQNSLKDRKIANINWVFKKNLHITLKFFGEVKDDKIDELISKFENIKYSKFKLKLSKLCFYPSNLRINIIWAGFESDKNVIELQKLIDVETMNFGDIKLGGHITLGRVKSMKNKKGLLDLANKIKIKSLEFDVDSFILFKSILRREGPDYIVFKTYKLE